MLELDRRNKIKQRIVNVGLIIIAIVHAFSALSIAIIPILPITASIEREITPDRYSDAPSVFFFF